MDCSYSRQSLAVLATARLACPADFISIPTYPVPLHYHPPLLQNYIPVSPPVPANICFQPRLNSSHLIEYGPNCNEKNVMLSAKLIIKYSSHQWTSGNQMLTVVSCSWICFFLLMEVPHRSQIQLHSRGNPAGIFSPQTLSPGSNTTLVFPYEIL